MEETFNTSHFWLYFFFFFSCPFFLLGRVLLSESSCLSLLARTSSWCHHVWLCFRQSFAVLPRSASSSPSLALPSLSLRDYRCMSPCLVFRLDQDPNPGLPCGPNLQSTTSQQHCGWAFCTGLVCMCWLPLARTCASLLADGAQATVVHFALWLKAGGAWERYWTNDWQIQSINTPTQCSLARTALESAYTDSHMGLTQSHPLCDLAW